MALQQYPKNSELANKPSTPSDLNPLVNSLVQAADALTLFSTNCAGGGGACSGFDIGPWHVRVLRQVAIPQFGLA